MSIPFPTETVIEGCAKLLVPKLRLYTKGPSEYIPSLAPVFYNPRMKLNRDIAVLALQAFHRKISRSMQVTDPLTGCGVRGIRFALEVDGVETVALNDLSSIAVRLAEMNVKENGLAGKTKVTRLDGNLFLSTHASPRERFDAIDVDPYGSPSPFLDSAVRAIKGGGVLALTATDTAPLCGVNHYACIRKYMSKPLRSEYCRETAIRILLNALTFVAAKYDLGIDVLLSHSTNHYIRVYAQLERGAKRANAAIDKLGYILHCFRCLNRSWSHNFVQEKDRKCRICGENMEVAGPLWLGQLVEREFCRNILVESRKMTSIDRRGVQLLQSLINEAYAPPTFYVIDMICDRLNLPIPPKELVLEKLVSQGYAAIETHFGPTTVKTNAPIESIKGIMFELVRS